MIYVLSLLFACGGAQDHDHPHDHSHDQEHAHDHGDADHDHEGSHDHEGGHDHAEPAASLEAKMGAYTAKMEPGEGQLKLVLTDASGAAVTPEGEARVVLTPAKGEPQKLLLKPDGDAWVGPAKLGEGSHTAVVVVEIAGTKQAGRFGW